MTDVTRVMEIVAQKIADLQIAKSSAGRKFKILPSPFYQANYIFVTDAVKTASRNFITTLGESFMFKSIQLLLLMYCTIGPVFRSLWS